MTPESPTGTSEFNISTKSTHEWLTDHKMKLSTNTVRNQITNDIYENARELNSEIDWSFVLDHVRAQRPGAGIVRGVPAITHLLSRSIGSHAERMGWDMHSPEIVYMSGYFFYQALNKEFDRLEEQIRASDEGKRKFLTSEARETKIQQERDEAEKINTFKQRLDESLKAYSQHNGLIDAKHLVVLQALLSIRYAEHKKRDQLIKLLKNGDIEGAFTFVSEFYATAKLH